MPLYKYDVLVDLPSDEDARQMIKNIHLTVCGGDTRVAEGGEIVHECRRWFTASVAGYLPVPDEDPVEGAVEFIEDTPTEEIEVTNG